MADSENVYDQSRESQVYITAEIQGYLEKKGTGVLRSKAKTWCSLQGLTLYLQKSQGDVMSTIDVRDVHQVRKIPTDVSGSQFEICHKKKSHIFICQTSHECQAWVTALQKAMALKEEKPRNSNFFVDIQEDNLYSTVEETNSCTTSENKSSQPNVSETQKTLKISEYAEPYDKKASETFTSQESEYSEIGDVASSSTNKSPKTEVSSDAAKNKVLDSEQEYYTEATSVAQGNNTFSQEDYTDAKTSVPLENKVSQEAYSDGYSVVMKRSKQTVSTFSDNTEAPVMRNDEDDGEDLWRFLDKALEDDKILNPDFVHPLTSDDEKPIAELKAFMHNNKQFFRSSYGRVTTDSDPVEDLKSVLRSMNVIS